MIYNKHINTSEVEKQKKNKKHKRTKVRKGCSNNITYDNEQSSPVKLNIIMKVMIYNKHINII